MLGTYQSFGAAIILGNKPLSIATVQALDQASEHQNSAELSK